MLSGKFGVHAQDAGPDDPTDTPTGPAPSDPSETTTSQPGPDDAGEGED